MASPPTPTGSSTTASWPAEPRSASPRRRACCSRSARAAMCSTLPAGPGSTRRCSPDGSQAMVEVAATRFRREGLAIAVQRCLWADLPAAIDERFDVVLCSGNALVHAAGRDAMVQALTGLRRMARPGGHLVVDSRNWEKLHAERRIVEVMNRVRMRGGRRCVVLYAWEVPDRFDQEHIAHLVFLFEDGDRGEPHEYLLSFRPFTFRDLRERLELAGLREADTDYGEAADRYAVIAVAT